MVGDKLKFYSPFSTLTSNLTTPKIHWNNILSTPGSKYLLVYTISFYLNNLISYHEYYKILISHFPQDVIDKYELADKQVDIFLYIRVEKGMYGLVKAGIISHTSLKE